MVKCILWKTFNKYENMVAMEIIYDLEGPNENLFQIIVFKRNPDTKETDKKRKDKAFDRKTDRHHNLTQKQCFYTRRRH